MVQAGWIRRLGTSGGLRTADESGKTAQAPSLKRRIVYMSSRFHSPACRIRAARFIATVGLALSFAMSNTSAEAAGRHASMVIDANTGQILHAQAADEPRYPASLTKMMTLYIVFELIEQGRLSPGSKISISDEAAGTSPSKLGLPPGSEIAVGDAVRALITKSANDIAVALAEHIAGTEPKFAALMTRKARQLGMNATTFRNAHGLPDSGQVTTARDMLTLAVRLSDDFPSHYRLFSLRSFSYNGKTYANHNTMLGQYQGMDGLKTGYTTPSGFNLVASVRRNGRHVVAAVFGGNSASARNAYMRQILDRTLPRASPDKSRAPQAVARVNRPERQHVAARTTNEDKPAPQLLEPVRQVARPQPVAVTQPEPQVAQAPATPTTIQVARVRPVVVALRQRPAPIAAVPPAQDAPQPQLVALAAPAAAFVNPAPVARGAAPSSLQAQAQRLERGAAHVVPQAVARPQFVTASAAPMQPTYQLKGPDVAPRSAQPASSGAAVALQIGAYASEAEAQRYLAAASDRAGALLSGASPSTQAVQTGGRQLYRARFVGLDPSRAATVCTELRRAQIDCMVTPR